MIASALAFGIAAFAEAGSFVEFVESDIVPLVAEEGAALQATTNGATFPAETSVPAPSPPPGEPMPEESLRDPFWPVGFRPPTPVVSVERKPSGEEAQTNALVSQIDWDGAREQLMVQGVVRQASGGYMAVVNGQILEQGSEIEIVWNGVRYRWAVSQVTERGVSFARRSAEPLGSQ